MRRGTTPTLTVTVDADIHDWETHVYISNGGNDPLDLEGARLTMAYENGVTTVTFTLTQEETLAFEPAPCELQVRAAKGGVAVATDIRRVPVGRILKGGVIGGE